MIRITNGPDKLTSNDAENRESKDIHYYRWLGRLCSITTLESEIKMHNLVKPTAFL